MEDISIKGINYGKYNLDEQYFSAENLKKYIFKIPLSKITNSQIINKNDIVFDVNFEDQDDQDDKLCEMRFYIPPNTNNEEVEKENKQDVENSDEEQKQNQEQSQAEMLNLKILEKAHISEFAGDSIVRFDEIPLIIPRGKYAVDLYKSFIKFHGGTYNYKLEYKNIQRAFLLPKIDDVHMAFVLALEKPLRQGNTIHQYIVMQFKKETQDEVKIKLSEEQRVKDYGQVLKEEYSGPLFDIVTKLFKIIVGVNIIIPGNFRSSLDQAGIRCSVKAQEGVFFPLQKSLIFINKPVIYIRLEEIVRVEFHRIGSGIQSKLFDLTIRLKDKNVTHTFSTIDKSELDKLVEYFKQRKVKVETIQDNPGANYDYDDDEDDDDDVSIETNEEGDDQKKKKRKAAGKNKKQALQEMAENGDDEDDEDDESFKADEESAGSSDDDDDGNFMVDESIEGSENSQGKPKKKKISKNTVKNKQN